MEMNCVFEGRLLCIIDGSSWMSFEYSHTNNVLNIKYETVFFGKMNFAFL